MAIKATIREKAGLSSQDGHSSDASHIPQVLAESEDEPQSPYHLSWRTLVAFFALAMGNTCAALANTGSLSDRVGKKWFLVIGCLIGVIGSCISGSAQTLSTIVGGNVLTGIANAGCIVSISCIQEIMPNKLRPWALGVSQALASIFVVLGTFMAAAVVRDNTGGHGGWRWAYYFNGIIYGCTALAVAVTYFPPPPRLGKGKHVLRDLLTKVDYIGITIMTGSFAALVNGLTWGGSTYAWDDGKIIAPLVVGCLGLVAFGLYETFVVKEGILDHRLFQTRNFPILLVVCTIDGMLLLGVNVLFSQEIFDLFTQDAVQIAVILSPFLITSTFGCIPSGWIMWWTKSYRLLLAIALFWCSLFSGLMSLATSSRLSWVYGFSTMLGIGTAVTTTLPIVALGLSVPSYLLGTAATVSVSCRALGGIVGITILTAVYNNKYTSYVGPLVASSPFVEPPYLDQSAEAWRFVWVVIACIVAATGFASCGLQSVQPMMNGHIESALENRKVRDGAMDTDPASSDR
ncbi:hypothetical protein G7054_g6486 [Neopestalotiopsis clavispora]|nr:hypothetical protein G7054_g6486 [Neopestalotiopsis clavispora]